MPNRPAPFPVHLAAHGPRSLELAGEVADGVWLGTGVHEEDVRAALARVIAGAARAGRDPGALEVAVFVRCFVGSRDAGLRALSPSLAAVGHYALARVPAGKDIPAALLPAFAELHHRYDPIAHAVGGAEAPNARLIRELGLLDYLAHRFAIIGSAAEVASRLRGLAAAGVGTAMVFLRGEDLDGQMRRFGAEVIALL